MTIRNTAILVLCLGIGMVWLVRVRSAQTDEITAEPHLLHVATRSARLVKEFARLREFTGTVVAARDSQLGFERPGRIMQLQADEGDKVQSGAVLARLDVGQVESRLQSLQAQLNEAQAKLREFEAGPRKQSIAAARALVDSLAAEEKRLRLVFQRNEELLTKSAISKERFDDSQYALASAVARRESSQKTLDELLAGTRVEQLEAQRAVVARLRADIDATRQDLADGEIIAPFAGRIAERYLDDGTVVKAGEAVFRLIEDQQLEAWFGLPANSASELVVGENAPLEIEGHECVATISSLRPSLDPVTRTQNVIVKLGAADAARVVPGQIARLRLTQTVPETGCVVPTTALVPGPRGLWNILVAVPEGQHHFVEQRQVQLLYTLGQESLVRGTLSEGELVIVEGVHRVVAGQRVKINAETSQ